MKELQAALVARVHEYREIANTAPADVVRAASQAVKDARAELVAAITKGANPCPDCGSPPHGILHPKSVEVGCLNCRDHRAQGPTRASAVAAWNEGPEGWLPC